jgi:hypothetical protein
MYWLQINRIIKILYFSDILKTINAHGRASRLEQTNTPSHNKNQEEIIRTETKTTPILTQLVSVDAKKRATIKYNNSH